MQLKWHLFFLSFSLSRFLLLLVVFCCATLFGRVAVAVTVAKVNHPLRLPYTQLPPLGGMELLAAPSFRHTTRVHWPWQLYMQLLQLPLMQCGSFYLCDYFPLFFFIVLL